MTRRGFEALAVMALLCLGGVAQAAITIDTVTVGDPGNAPDLRFLESGAFGSVDHTYNIGKYEVTAAQYTDFLNNKAKSDPYGLYNSEMWSNLSGCKIQQSGSSGSYTYTVASDWADRPVNYVCFMDSVRFANWLNNGQGDGDTETGAYTLGGYNGDDGHDIRRTAGAKWFVPSDNEWYKAAYYKGGGTNAGYWTFATQSDAIPSSVPGSPTDPGNNATFNGTTIGSPYYRTEVGAHENSESAYGTFDQGGNVSEWNEAKFINWRGTRGGDFAESWAYLHAANNRVAPSNEEIHLRGFRVASIPEPSSLVALGSGLLWLLGLKRRKA